MHQASMDSASLIPLIKEKLTRPRMPFLVNLFEVTRRLAPVIATVPQLFRYQYVILSKGMVVTNNPSDAQTALAELQTQLSNMESIDSVDIYVTAIFQGETH